MLSYQFYTYLQEKLDIKGFVVEDSIDDLVFVYRFIFDDNVQEAETYYTIDNGNVIKVEK